MLKSSHTGFSLIELMVGLVILGMLMAAGVPSFFSFLQNRSIRNTAEEVVEGVNLAKAEAVRRNTSVNFSLDTLGAWTVGCATASAACPASIQARAATGGSSTVTTTAANLTFNGYGRATSLAAGSSATIDVTNTRDTCEAAGGTMRCLRVVVTPGGQVRMCDPKLASGNPRAC